MSYAKVAAAAYGFECATIVAGQIITSMQASLSMQLATSPQSIADALNELQFIHNTLALCATGSVALAWLLLGWDQRSNILFAAGAMNFTTLLISVGTYGTRLSSALGIAIECEVETALILSVIGLIILGKRLASKFLSYSGLVFCFSGALNLVSFVAGSSLAITIVANEGLLATIEVWLASNLLILLMVLPPLLAFVGFMRVRVNNP